MGEERIVASETDAAAKSMSDTDNHLKQENNDSDIVEMSVEEMSAKVESDSAKNRPANKKNEEKAKADKTAKRNAFKRFWKRRKGLIIFLVLVIAGIVAFILYNKKQKELEALSSVEQQEFDFVKRDDIRSTISTTGTIKAKKTSTLYSALKDTKITNVNYAVGDQVHEGDVVVTFSVENIEKQISEAEEDIAISRQQEALAAQKRDRDYLNTYASEASSLANAEESVNTALKNLYEACDGYGDAKRELQEAIEKGKSEEELSAYRSRVSLAYNTEQEAQKSYSDAVAALADKNRQSEYDIANAENSYASNNLNAGDSTRQLERKLETYKETLEDYVVTAPISGIVTKVEVEEGNGFNGGNLMEIQQNDSFVVTTEIDEYDIPNVELGQRVVIMTDATRDDELEGTVSFVSPTATTSQNGAATTGGVTYKVEIDIKGMDERLRIGMSAKLNIITDEHKDTLVVRYDAIEEKDNGDTVVYVVDNSANPAVTTPESGVDGSDQSGVDNGIPVVGVDGTVTGTPKKGDMPQAPTVNTREIPVTIGIEGDYYTEIISDELTEGMQVTVNAQSGQMGLDMFGMMGGARRGGSR